MKHDGKFCFASSQTMKSADSMGGLQAQMLNASAVCDDGCIRKLLFKAFELIDAIDIADSSEVSGGLNGVGAMLEKMRKYLCVKLPSTGKYCMDVYAGLGEPGIDATAAESDAPAPSCTALADAGCCLGVVQEVLPGAAAAGGPFQEYISNCTPAITVTTCDVSPKGEEKSIQMETDVLWSWVSQNEAAFKASVTADLGQQLGVAKDYIKEVRLSSSGAATAAAAKFRALADTTAAATTVVTVVLQTTDSTTTDKLAKTLATASTDGTLKLATTAKVYTNATGLTVSYRTASVLSDDGSVPTVSLSAAAASGPTAWLLGAALAALWGVGGQA